MKTYDPPLFKYFKWAPYPESSREAVPDHRRHRPRGQRVLAAFELSLAALACAQGQPALSATVGGLPPTLTSLYSDPAMFADYPFHADILQALEKRASGRRRHLPDRSIDISHLVSPPASINPVNTEQSMTGEVSNALQQKGLIP